MGIRLKNKLPTRPERYIWDPNVAQWIPTARVSAGQEREKQEQTRRLPPTAKKWLDALNNRGTPQAKSQVEIEAAAKELLSQFGGANPNSDASVQSSQLPGGVGVVRVNLTNQEQRSDLIALVGANTFSATLIVFEGWRGGKFVQSSYSIPVLGKTIPVKGDFVYAFLIQSFNPNTVALRMTVTIEPGDPREMYTSEDSTSALVVFAPLWATHVGYSVTGGVGIGDAVEITPLNQAGASVRSYPAREGGRHALGQNGGKCFYNRAALGVVNLVWEFYGWK